jgi:drug/metabolite transporter (DMT)-like permease
MKTALTADEPRLIDSRIPLVSALLILDSLHFVFAKLFVPYLPGSAAAMYVLAVGTIQVGLLGLARGRLHWRTLRRHFWFFLFIGALVGVGTGISFEAVAFIDAGTASLLSKTAILFGLGFGLLWLREKFTPAQLGGALIAIVGVFVITFQPGDFFRLGSLMVLASAFMYATHTAVVKRYGDQMEFLDFFFFRLLFTTFFLLLYTMSRKALVWPNGQAWLLLLVAGTVDVVISRTLYYAALQRLSLSVHSIVLTLSPVATVFWSLLLFDESLTTQQIVGGVAVLLGVLIVTLKRAD